jgi:hypothetical protein
MTQDEVIEMAIQGHASTREAIRWAINQEIEACAKIVEVEAMQYAEPVWAFEIVNDIRARGNNT